MSSALYQQAMLAHHQNPYGFETDIKPTHQQEGYNPACGDEITVAFEISNNMLDNLNFSGDSCAICRASASIMCQTLANCSLTEAKRLLDEKHSDLAEQKPLVGLLEPLNSVYAFPIRLQCALLPWQTAQVCLASCD
ncbi:iron-sulfur cluster assembly scaffold protein [Thalassotalea euphylliae]|uniref:Iron-sulfur cluster assembly scaffold protein n=1 Tax=Thalassotalea euphylliae TaxID=1655234 RepID=A0A3E0TN08_9GAMM|nr:iron-sulfur cluster assembly scaffold protein [Thalassotalea euphylliae]REL25971.1 iron-sulfur cluster assembly scaffold protein [Thalassotalea euphylliae]